MKLVTDKVSYQVISQVRAMIPPEIRNTCYGEFRDEVWEQVSRRTRNFVWDMMEQQSWDRAQAKLTGRKAFMAKGRGFRR